MRSRFLAAAVAAMVSAPALAEEPRAPTPREALRRTSVVEAVERACPSVVSIGTTRLVKERYWDWDFLLKQRERELRGLGSGVIVHPDGYVVTNAHVINQADQILVQLTGVDGADEDIPADLVDTDLAHDLALLRMRRPGPYPSACLGRSDDLMVGETVIAMGNPFGLGRTVTTGVISALGRTMNVRDQAFEGFIQTDAAVNQGNSGGALLNVLGEWIGVNSAIYSMSGGSDGISFAIPIATVREFLARARRAPGRWLGLEFGEDEAGVVVTTVYPVGPAAAAGVPSNARVLAADGHRADDVVQLSLALLRAAEQGAPVRLEVETPGGRREIVVPMERFPTAGLALDRLGLRVTEVTPEIAERSPYRVGSGIVVLEARDGGPGSRAGLARGDLLVAAGPRRLGSEEDLLLWLQFLRPGDPVELELVRPRRVPGGVDGESWKARLVAD